MIIKLAFKLNEKTKNGTIYTEDLLFTKEVKNKIKKSLIFILNDASKDTSVDIRNIFSIVRGYKIKDNELFLFTVPL